ncbi:hypothetical protein [Camelimonas lactis]|uniref:Uncharacterized protein n=1 Tax=Camelimonas lactis TaxID=659006 RepID=A0A4R2GSX4_9HYPH|nr:hypothetical protein [Camelimonas lactis]TCO13452.1 hypothetical protein EV666_106165 [Camelimonas lactis]
MARRDPNAPIGKRASKREKVDVAIVPRAPEWQPNWELIETAWDCEVPDDARAEIADAVRTYLRDESFVRAAPFKDDVVKKLAALRKAADAYAKAIRAFGRGAGSAAAHARLRPLLPVVVEDQKSHLSKQARDADNVALAAGLALDELDGKPQPEPAPALDLDAVVVRAVALLSEELRDDPVAINEAINQALAEENAEARAATRAELDDDDIDDHSDMIQGAAREWAAWDDLLVALRAIARRHGLNTTVDLGGIGDGDGPEGGAFAAAVAALGSTLPPGFMRPHGSRKALAMAILRAVDKVRY